MSRIAFIIISCLMKVSILQFIQFVILLYSFINARKRIQTKDGIVVGERIVKGKRNAIYLIDNTGDLHLFPDFYTFTSLGFNLTDIKTIDDASLSNMHQGSPIKSIPAPPPFRPDDFMYHELCQEPRRMVDDLSVVSNMGNYERTLKIISKVHETKHLNILALGGSITAGGYYLEFVRFLEQQDNITVTVHNHGHGATAIPYTLYCVDMVRYKPDLVMIDFSVNDDGHPKLMDALIRKVLLFPSNPIIVLVNLWVHSLCPTPRYLTHSYYYNIPLINICPAANLCYGRRLPRYITESYSKTDGVHPWGEEGVPFIGKLLYAWWKRNEEIFSSTELINQNNLVVNEFIKQPLYTDNPIGLCTRCDALVEDADAKLTPVESPIGFHIVTRVKIGFGGFESNKSTKSFKKSWQSDIPDSKISFRFYGSSVSVGIWQRRDAMGVLYATVDGNTNNIAKASGFFKGYTWAMERNNTGRTEIVPLFEGLEDKEHIITFTVSHEPANVWVKGHLCQVFALLSASNNMNCKNITL